MSLRFIHTGDWHVGMKEANAPEVADRVRDARLEVIDRIRRLAQETKADFVVVAGDVFEHNQVGRKLARDVLRRLGDYPVDVYIIPGNHDYAGPNSIYKTRAFQDVPPKVHVLLEQKPVVIRRLNVILYPCPVTQKRTALDPTDWIPVEEPNDMIRIGLAHGSVAEFGFGDLTDNPVSLRNVEAKSLDYLAMGHWHSTSVLSPRAAYCGAPETTGYTEKDSGNALLVSIDRPGSEPQVSVHRVGKLKWVEMEHELSLSVKDSLDQLRAKFNSLQSDSGDTLIRLRLSGVSTGEALARMEDVLDDFRSTYLHIEVDTSSVVLDPDGDKLFEWAKDRPLTRAVLSDLKRLIDASSHDEAAAAWELAANPSGVDLAAVLKRAELPEDEDGAITREVAQAALVEMLKALEGITR